MYVVRIVGNGLIANGNPTVAGRDVELDVRTVADTDLLRQLVDGVFGLLEVVAWRKLLIDLDRSVDGSVLVLDIDGATACVSAVVLRDGERHGVGSEATGAAGLLLDPGTTLGDGYRIVNVMLHFDKYIATVGRGCTCIAFNNDGVALRLSNLERTGIAILDIFQGDISRTGIIGCIGLYAHADIRGGVLYPGIVPSGTIRVGLLDFIVR